MGDIAMKDTALSYEILRSDRRTVSLEVRPDGSLLVRAPKRMRRGDIDRFVQSHKGWADKHIATVLARQSSPYRSPLTREETDALYERAKEILPPLVATWADRMGVTYTAVTVTAAQKRFGSCSAQNRLCFSYRLMRYPYEAIEYVVVHELAHILHKNHSRDFYACVEAYLPDYRERAALLRM